VEKKKIWNSDSMEFEQESRHHIEYELFLLSYLDNILIEISGYAITKERG